MKRLALLLFIVASCDTKGVTYNTVCNGEGATSVAYSLDGNGWADPLGWKFKFNYLIPYGTYNDWTLQLIFDQPLVKLEPYNAVVSGSYDNGRMWLLTAQSWNHAITNSEEFGEAMAYTSAGYALQASVYIYNNGAVPDTSGNCNEQSSSTTTTTTESNTVSTSSPDGNTVVTTLETSTESLNPYGNTGNLPPQSYQVDITDSSYIRSQHLTADEPYDYNEILFKSILFYQAQRSGRFTSDNLIPWRGDSGLIDGCVYGTCYTDLTGGWYDAGDFVKFGLPMAYTATVLAWGMIEFQPGYESAGQWDNALDMLKWATDYFVKAHVSPNELYFQVGDGHADHSYWGHPETMTMARPIFKVDTAHPGSEVSAETAAALAASYLVFRNSDSAYAENLKSHAIQLYDFAYNYRGNYHETVAESRVADFYKSWNGYNDELMWGAMWLYKITNDNKYLQYAEELAPSVDLSEFSWDSKGPGAYVLLSQYKSEYRSTLDSALNSVMNKEKTPGGLTYFSEWGTNRYAANYALIALATAKMDALSSSIGNTYYLYARDQISKMLGSGDGGRSYVVGFGNNPPTQPHHRSSSCRSWNPDPASQVCDSTDEHAHGPNPQILYGALVGGPGRDGSYHDDRGDYVKNEVATDYNAGFQSAVAALRYFQIGG